MNSSGFLASGSAKGFTWTFMVFAACISAARAQVDWVPRHPDESPYGAMSIVYDTRENQLSLFADVFRGQRNDWWRWDGLTWTAQQPRVAPHGRTGFGLSYDSARQRAVLFGGLYFPYGNRRIPFGDTWEWDGSQWIQPETSASPGLRFFHSMAYDSARGVTVLFGGYSWTAGVQADTWLWNGAGWTLVSPATIPQARSGAAMAFDPDRARMVMFGGYYADATGTQVNLQDTWEWDGINWMRMSPAASPSRRMFAAMAYDPRRHRMVLSCGRDYVSYSSVNDTWEWDGTNWTQLVTNHAPPSGAAGMAYDPRCGQLLLIALSTNPLSTYVLDSQPEITSVSPVEGSESGGDEVRVIGRGIADLATTTVTFGGVPATVRYQTRDGWTVTTPPGSGDVEVRVTNDLGTAIATSTYRYYPPAIVSRLGNVNLGSGTRENVVLVDGSVGDLQREMTLTVGGPIQIYVGSPSSRDSAPFALYAWIGSPGEGSLTPLPRGLGTMVFPVPFAGSNPQPAAIFNNLGRRRVLGAPDFPSSPAPTVVVDRARGARSPVDFTLQGIIRDDRSLVPEGFSITNAVVVHVVR